MKTPVGVGNRGGLKGSNRRCGSEELRRNRGCFVDDVKNVVFNGTNTASRIQLPSKALVRFSATSPTHLEREGVRRTILICDNALIDGKLAQKKFLPRPIPE